MKGKGFLVLGKKPQEKENHIGLVRPCGSLRFTPFLPSKFQLWQWCNRAGRQTLKSIQRFTFLLQELRNFPISCSHKARLPNCCLRSSRYGLATRRSGSDLPYKAPPPSEHKGSSTPSALHVLSWPRMKPQNFCVLKIQLSFTAYQRVFQLQSFLAKQSEINFQWNSYLLKSMPAWFFMKGAGGIKCTIDSWVVAQSFLHGHFKRCKQFLLPHGREHVTFTILRSGPCYAISYLSPVFFFFFAFSSLHLSSQFFFLLLKFLLPLQLSS